MCQYLCKKIFLHTHKALKINKKNFLHRDKRIILGSIRIRLYTKQIDFMNICGKKVVL